MAKVAKKTASKKTAVKAAKKVDHNKAAFDKELAKVKEQAKKKALATVEMMMAKRDQLIEEAIAEAAKKFEKLFGSFTKAEKAAKKPAAKKAAPKKAPAKNAAVKKPVAKKTTAKKPAAKKTAKKK